MAHCTKGLELLQTLPDTPACQHELLLHMTLRGPLMATKGFGAPEVERATWARELCQQAGRQRSSLRCWRDCRRCISQAELQKARELESSVSP